MKETVMDIVHEMRERTARKAEEAWYDQKAWAELCDRLEAASRVQCDMIVFLVKFVGMLRDTLAGLVGAMPDFGGAGKNGATP